MQSDHLLHSYYKHLFPSNLICSWLAYSDSNPDGLLRHRQFNFTMDINGEEVYERYISFRNSSEMKRMLLDKLPIKIDIGAVMQQIPKKGVVNTPSEREFVLDIDIDDYDNVRTCCHGPTLCKLCWKFMRLACHVLYRAMYQDFGFRHMMFVFSGRRGLHLWVCDKKARQMEEYNRKSIMNYLYLVTGNSESTSQLAPGVLTEVKLNYNPKKEMRKFIDRQRVKQEYISTKIHPFIRRSLEMIEPNFTEIFEEQNIMNDPDRRKVVEKILDARSPILLEKVKRRWEGLSGAKSSKLLAVMVEEVEIYERFTDLYKNRKEIPTQFILSESPLQYLSFVEEEMMLAFMYPRLDVNVSTGMNHLLKCPFSVHPKSKKLSVPFKGDSIDTFDPDAVVTINQLIKEYQILENEEPERLRDKPAESVAKYTSLNEAINVLEELVIRVAKENRADKFEF